MKKFVEIVFCKIYGALKEDFNAMGILTILFSLNVFTLIGYYKALVEHTDHILIPTIYEILIVILIGCLNYFLFLKDKKYETIYKEFKKEPMMSGRRGTWLTFFYILATIIIFSSLIWVGRINLKGV